MEVPYLGNPSIGPGEPVHAEFSFEDHLLTFTMHPRARWGTSPWLPFAMQIFRVSRGNASYCSVRFVIAILY
jgi:hypothetical protein